MAEPDSFGPRELKIDLLSDIGHSPEPEEEEEEEELAPAPSPNYVLPNSESEGSEEDSPSPKLPSNLKIVHGNIEKFKVCSTLWNHS